LLEKQWKSEAAMVLLLIDRERKKVLRSVGSSDPKKTAAWFGR
jgi:hypothetical protein